jgi:hypothetical protein
MITATKRARERARAARWMAMATKRARATATRVVGNKKGNVEGSDKKGDGDGNKEGDGNQRQQHNNGYGEEGGGHLMVAKMGMAQRTWPLTLWLERGG